MIRTARRQIFRCQKCENLKSRMHIRLQNLQFNLLFIISIQSVRCLYPAVYSSYQSKG